MYDEISFLFEKATEGDQLIDRTNIFNYTSDLSDTDIYYRNVVSRKKLNENGDIIYKELPGRNEITTNLSESSLNGVKNPYISIIEKLNYINQMRISSADIAYLTELGVYPVNRLVILRRYAENVTVPHNLNDLDDDIEPISTVIGWVSPEDEKLFSITFKEKWETTTDMFWDTIAEAVKQDTGISLKSAVPVPGWAQSFLFKFLTDAGLAPKNWEKGYIPIGDPDVLKESSTRETNSQGLDSQFSFTLKTSYEQKYINGVDPGSAMIDIINNTLRMGTSDMKYILGGEFIKNFANIITEGRVADWTKKIKELAIIFMNTLKVMIGENIEKAAASANFTSTSTGTTQGGFNIEDAFTAAIRRFRWPLKGSLGVTSGIHTTPWHLTVGNPLNPIISIANILVDGELSFGNELGFNDMPTKIDVTFNINLSRSLGKNEIIQILDNTYGREYSKA